MSAEADNTPKVYIFRHGETDWALEGCFTGITEIELNQNGKAQILIARNTLVGPDKLIDPRYLARVFVSPRLRTKQTFDLLLSSDSNSKNVTYTEDIREWNYGAYEGLKDEEIRRSRKERGLDVGKEWEIRSDGCEDGESPEQVTQRLDELMLRITDIQKHLMHGQKQANVLIVGHGLTLRCFAKRWVGLPIDAPPRMELPPGGVGILSYKHRDVNKRTMYAGIALPSQKEHE